LLLKCVFMCCYLEVLWCPEEDSNLHGFHHWYLKPARLPIPPSGPTAPIKDALPRLSIGLRCPRDVAGERGACDDPNRAIGDYTEAIRLHPDDAGLYDRRAAACGFQRDFARAISDCDQMIRINRGDPLPYCRRGEIYCGTGAYDKAIIEYDRAIAIAQRPDHYFQRGNVHLKRADYAAAIADFDEAISAPTDAFIFFRAPLRVSPCRPKI
jgi:tetratricopeptide (TPR) repeat protein